MEDRGSVKKEKERQKKEEKERQKREEAQEKLRKKEEKQRRKEEESGKKKKGFFTKLKSRGKHPASHDDPLGGASGVSSKLSEEEFVFVRGEDKEKAGATGGVNGMIICKVYLYPSINTLDMLNIFQRFLKQNIL